SRAVAVKVLDPSLSRDEVYRDRFLLEARIAARVEHPNVVAVYDAAVAGDLLYLILQLVRGGDLATYARGRRLPAGEVMTVGLAVDGRTDLYALGVTLYQLLAARLPYDLPSGSSAMTWYVAHAKDTPAPLGEAAPGTPPGLIRLIERLMAKEQAGRPESAAA